MPQVAAPPVDSTEKVAYDFYYEAKEKGLTMPQIYLTEDEEDDRRNDYQEIMGMKLHHADQHENWAKAGNFYNIVQSGEGADSVSRYAVGLSRTIIDTGISMMNQGEPEGAFIPIQPSDKNISILWDALVKHQLKKSNWPAHQKLFTTDLHIFGSSCLEAFVNPVVRRPNEEPGAFFIRMAREARTGLRHRSIWYSFRNPNVNDPDAVPSCSWEEIVTRGEWITKYANRPDFQYTDQIKVASKYKLTHIVNEWENTHRIYSLPFGVMAEAHYEPQPNWYELGVPVYSAKLTDLNPLGMSPMAFGIFNDQLTPDFKQHSLYGMGIPQLIEGMEMIMEGLFNMTVDNLRYKNTVPVGYQPYQGQTDYPDLDNIILESGRVYPGTFTPQSLGMADIASNQKLWEWINNLCIWLTGYNFQQLGGDTSKTAYEFSQRLRANSQRAAQRLVGLENGPFRRSWMLTLANSLEQVKKDEWENITGSQAKDIAELIKSGEVATNDYDVQGGNVKRKKFVEYFPVNNYKIQESFKKSPKRKLDTNSLDGTNTLQIEEKKGEKSMAAATPEYLFPGGQISQMLAFTVDIVSKTMLGDQKVQDQQAINNALIQAQTFKQLGVQQFSDDLIFALWKQGAEDAGLDVDSVMKSQEDSPILAAAKKALQNMQNIKPTPTPNAAPPTNGQPTAPQPPSPPVGPPAQAGAAVAPPRSGLGVPTGLMGQR